jgi:hypothetical protein
LHQSCVRTDLSTDRQRISTAHVESTVNQLINWRMCKKHQMGWSREL